jgi:aminoglycoside phosphotransferase (APT) family kinase protein
LTGALFERQRDDFARHFDATLPSLDQRSLDSGAGGYDLACLDLRGLPSRSERIDALGAAAALLRDGGGLVVATRDPVTLESLRRGRLGALRFPTLPAIRRALRAASIPSADEMLALPDHDSAEEHWRRSSRDFEPPAFGSVLERAARGLGLSRWIHGDVLLFALKGAASPLDRLGSELGAAMRALGAGVGPGWHIERLSARSRGALVLIAGDRDGDGHILRVATSSRVAERLGRNAACTASLHANAGLPARWRDVVPRGYGGFEIRGSWCYVERRVPGVLAWKLPPNGAAAARAGVEAKEFLVALGAATGRVGALTDRHFDSIIGAAIGELARRWEDEPDAARIVGRILERLRAALLGKHVRTVLGHGDFGFGNLLVDRATGELRGVIDWDTSIPEELEDVDWANLRIQLGTRGHGGDTARAVRDLLADPSADHRVATAVAALRMVLRTLPYESEFAAQRSAHLAIVREVEDRTAEWSAR